MPALDIADITSHNDGKATQPMLEKFLILPVERYKYNPSHGWCPIKQPLVGYDSGWNEWMWISSETNRIGEIWTYKARNPGVTFESYNVF